MLEINRKTDVIFNLINPQILIHYSSLTHFNACILSKRGYPTFINLYLYLNPYTFVFIVADSQIYYSSLV
jgi:hypothetical protein